MVVYCAHGVVCIFDDCGDLVMTLGDGVLGSPAGAAFSACGERVIVSDGGVDEILVFSLKDGSLLSRLETEGEGYKQLRIPFGLALDPRSNTVYLADSGNNRICVFQLCPDDTLSFVSSIGGYETTRFDNPCFVCMTPLGNIIVSDSYNNNVVELTRQGDLVRFWGHHGDSGWKPGRFNRPMGVAFDSKDRLWVVDSGNHRVLVFGNGGELLCAIGSGDVFGEPRDISVNVDDCLVFVTDSASATVHCIRFTPNLSEAAFLSPLKYGELCDPLSMCSSYQTFGRRWR